MTRPIVIRHTVPEYVETTFSCLSCGEDIEYDEGLSCVRCGLEWDSPTAEPTLADFWIEFAWAVAPNATAEKPTHLMIYRESEYYEAHAWYIHIGCTEDRYDHTGKCALTTVVGTSSWSSGTPELSEIVDGVPYALYDSGVRRTLPTGVYEVEAFDADDQHRVRVIAVLAYAGGDKNQNLEELQDPREAQVTSIRRDAVFVDADVVAYAWEQARSPEFLAYLADKEESRRRMAAGKAAGFGRSLVDVKLPDGVD